MKRRRRFAVLSMAGAAQKVVSSLMELKSIDLRQLSELKYEFYLGQLPSKRFPSLKFLLVKFIGKCGHGAAGNGDAHFIAAIAKAGLEAWDTSALVYDFTDLTYEWGDQMVLPFCVGEGWARKRELPIAFITSEKNVAALTTLITDEMLSKPNEWLFGTLEEAANAVACKVES